MTIQEAVAKFKERFENNPNYPEMMAKIEKLRAEANKAAEAIREEAASDGD